MVIAQPTKKQLLSSPYIPSPARTPSPAIDLLLSQCQTPIKGTPLLINLHWI